MKNVPCDYPNDPRHYKQQFDLMTCIYAHMVILLIAYEVMI